MDGWIIKTRYVDVYPTSLCRSSCRQAIMLLGEKRLNCPHLSHFIFVISKEHVLKQLQVIWLVITSYLVVTCSTLTQIQIDGHSQEKTEETWFVC